jgi:hypothetical protein
LLAVLAAETATALMLVVAAALVDIVPRLLESLLVVEHRHKRHFLLELEHTPLRLVAEERLQQTEVLLLSTQSHALAVVKAETPCRVERQEDLAVVQEHQTAQPMLVALEQLEKDTRAEIT